jgi:hypothetical protein
VHIHSLSYSPSQTGDAVTVSCTSTYGTCDLDPKGVTLTIKAPENLYTDGKVKTATLEGLDAFNAATGKSIAATDIKYAGRGTTTYAESDTAPTNAGKYTAKITVEGKTSSVNYDIGVKRPCFARPSNPARTGLEGVTKWGLLTPISFLEADHFHVISPLFQMIGEISWRY